MSFLIVVVVGAITGFAAGQFLKGAERGPLPDMAAGAIGACAIVLISRVLAPSLTGLVVSFVISVIGALGFLYVMRRFMKEKPLPVSQVRRRW